MLRSGKSVDQVEAEAAHLSLSQGKVLDDIAVRNRRKDLWRRRKAAADATAAEKLRSVKTRNASQQQRRLTLKRKALDSAAAKSQQATAGAATSRKRKNQSLKRQLQSNSK